MQQAGFYVTLKDLPGLPAGRVERFYTPVSLERVHAGEITPYVEDLHADLPGAPARVAKAAGAGTIANKVIAQPVRQK